MAALVDWSIPVWIPNDYQNIYNWSVLSHFCWSFWWNIQVKWRRRKIFTRTSWILMQQASYPQYFVCLGMHWFQSLLCINSIWCYFPNIPTQIDHKNIISSKDQLKCFVSAREDYYCDEGKEEFWLFNNKWKVKP